MLHTLALGRQAAALLSVHRCAHRIPRSWEPPSPGELGLVFPRTPLAILVRRRAERLRSVCVRVSTCRPLFHLNSDRCGTRLPRYSLREPCMVCHIAEAMRWRDVTPAFPGVTSGYRAMPRCTPPRTRTGNIQNLNLMPLPFGPEGLRDVGRNRTDDLRILVRRSATEPPLRRPLAPGCSDPRRPACAPVQRSKFKAASCAIP